MRIPIKLNSSSNPTVADNQSASFKLRRKVEVVSAKAVIECEELVIGCEPSFTTLEADLFDLYNRPIVTNNSVDYWEGVAPTPPPSTLEVVRYGAPPPFVRSYGETGGAPAACLIYRLAYSGCYPYELAPTPANCAEKVSLDWGLTVTITGGAPDWYQVHETPNSLRVIFTVGTTVAPFRIVVAINPVLIVDCQPFPLLAHEVDVQ